MTDSITSINIKIQGKGCPANGGLFNISGGGKSNATGRYTTNTSGAVISVSLISHGDGYTVEPLSSSVTFYEPTASPSIPAVFEIRRASGAQLSFCTPITPPVQSVASPGAAVAASGRWSYPSANTLLLAESMVLSFSIAGNDTSYTSNISGGEAMYLLVSSRWNGVRIALTNTTALLTPPDHAVLYRCALPLSGNITSNSQCKCVQVISGASHGMATERWHNFVLQGDNYLAAAIYRDTEATTLATDDPPTASWSVIFPMDTSYSPGGCAQGQTTGPVQTGDATYIRSTGAVALTTFLMNDTSRHTQVCSLPCDSILW
jgi:hypothetical protein